MKNIRIMPRLDIKGPNVVKPVHTEALHVVGDPKELAQRYYQQGADEVIYMDIVASLYDRSLFPKRQKNLAPNALFYLLKLKNKATAFGRLILMAAGSPPAWMRLNGRNADWNWEPEN